MFQITDCPENDYQLSCVHQFCTDVFIFTLSSLLWLLEQHLSTCLLFIFRGGGTMIYPTKVYTSLAFCKIYQASVNLFLVLVGIYKFKIA